MLLQLEGFDGALVALRILKDGNAHLLDVLLHCLDVLLRVLPRLFEMLVSHQPHIDGVIVVGGHIAVLLGHRLLGVRLPYAF